MSALIVRYVQGVEPSEVNVGPFPTTAGAEAWLMAQVDMIDGRWRQVSIQPLTPPTDPVVPAGSATPCACGRYYGHTPGCPAVGAGPDPNTDLADILADWQIRYHKARPDAAEIITALDVRGWTLTRKATS